MEDTTQTLAAQIAAAVLGTLGVGAAVARTLRGASADRTAIADDGAKRSHLATLQAENTQLRERHDSMSAKYTEAMQLAGQLAGKVEAQTATIESLRAEVQSLRELVSHQSETIESLRAIVERFIETDEARHEHSRPAAFFTETRIPENRNGSGPLVSSADPAPPAQP